MEKIEKELTDTIFEKTGKDIKKGEYGFIAGTMHPFMEKAEMGYMSASLVEGYQLWKKTATGHESIMIRPKNFDDSLEKIVEFLNK